MALAIIPAAGFGRRVGSPEAKELFLHPRTHKPLIQEAINLAKSWKLKVLVITRAEKRSLIEFFKKDNTVNLQIIEPSQEWPDTVLKSQSHWHEENLVLLPDTDFEPKNKNIIKNLSPQTPISFATFKVCNGKNWGVIKNSNGTFYVGEKIYEDNVLAWGYFAFKKEIGEDLLKKMLESTKDNQWKPLNVSLSLENLSHFEDFTRGTTRA